MKARFEDFIPVYGIISYFGHYFRDLDKPTMAQQNAAIAMQMYHTFMLLFSIVLAMHLSFIP